jgi:Bacterial PH domain
VTEREQLHAVFRPRRARPVALWVAGVQFAVLAGGALLVLPYDGPGTVGWADRLGIMTIAAAAAWLLWRLGSVAAWPSETGLRVRNLLTGRELDWAQIVSVTFGGGGPWVLLDLDDGDTLAVMAVQRADGGFGQSEATRLATLVALHSRTSQA